MCDRSIEFDRIQNARDLGGLRAADGRVIAPGLLIRSANLAEATEADVRILREKYHLAKIIDLRTEAERREKPDAAMDTVEYLPIPIFEAGVAGISHEQQNGSAQLLAILPKMEPLYRRMVTEPSCRENLGRAARCVMEHDFSRGSVLWHCTEGKDRCGLLSAVLLLALGTDRSAIMEDYLLTNRVNAPKAERYARQMRAAGKSEMEAAAIRDVFLAKREYLSAAFSAIDAQFSDADAFLRDGLSLSEELIDRFRSSVLASAAGTRSVSPEPARNGDVI